MTIKKLESAWRRVYSDFSKNKQFIKPIGLIEAIDKDPGRWLSEIEQKILRNVIVPSPNQIINIPKGSGLVRPGSIISLDDLLVYFYCIEEFLPKIYEELQWSQNEVDFGYTLNNNWIEDGTSGWESFRLKSLEFLNNENCNYVIITDLTGFYENIDIPILLSDLKSVNCDSLLVTLIGKLLNRWSQIAGRGIPQNNSASDILSKFYFDTIDKALRIKKIEHLRFVDDIRIFCQNKQEAKKALVTLTELCRSRGLNLQSAKTKILDKSDAYNYFQGIQPIISKYYKDSKFHDFVDSDWFNPYAQVEEAFEEINTKIESSKSEILARIYIDNFLNPDLFDKSLFHFVINKLISCRNFEFVTHSIDMLIDYPQETEYILKYLDKSIISEVGLVKYDQNIIKIKNILISEELIYDYQCYKLIYFFNKVRYYEKELLDYSRNIAENLNKPNYFRIICMIYLAGNGNKADIHLIENFITNSTNHFEKAETLIAIKNLEESRRKSICEKLEEDHIFIGLMIKYVTLDHDVIYN